jgi:hypothetical protein
MSDASVLAVVLGAALMLLGLCVLVAPVALGSQFGVGVHGDSAAAFVRATGVRDVALGIVLVAIALLPSSPLLITFACVGMAVSLADLTIAARHSGKRMQLAYLVHAGGLLAFAALLGLALSGARL